VGAQEFLRYKPSIVQTTPGGGVGGVPKPPFLSGLAIIRFDIPDSAQSASKFTNSIITFFRQNARYKL